MMAIRSAISATAISSGKYGSSSAVGVRERVGMVYSTESYFCDVAMAKQFEAFPTKSSMT